MKRVAILSPLFYYQRGAEYTAVVLCEALNQKGIIPDIYAFEHDRDEIKKRFNKEIKYRFKRIQKIPNSFLKLRGYISMYAFIKMKDISGYDFVYDMLGYDVAFGRRNDGRYLLYCHYPYFLEQFPKQLKDSGILKKLYYLPIIAASKIICKQKQTKVHMAANSEFTKKVLQKHSKLPIDVIYPPVRISINTDRKKEDLVVTLGAFDEDKRQLLQLEAARRNPGYKFYICGHLTNKSYFLEVSRKAKKLKNVVLKPNIQFPELQNLLKRSRYFLHTKKEEHFGISIVEAIAAGCIPIVHDSGGQKEIVTDRKFRYSSDSEMFNKFRELAGADRKKMMHHIKRFDESVYKEKMLSFLD